MKHKRQSNNGFQMFRLYVRDQLRGKGQRLTEEELIKTCSAEWAALTDDEKVDWKIKARGEKFKFRAENMSTNLAPDNSAVSANGGTSVGFIKRPERPPVPRPRNSAVRKNASVDSVLKAREETELLRNPAKRRHRDRDDFQTAFTWKYTTNLNELRSKKFYLFGSSVLHYTTDGGCVPAEVACVEFSISNGPMLCYCSPVKLVDGSGIANVENRVEEKSQRSHGFTVDDLSTIGKRPSFIADVIIDMSHEREDSCVKKRFLLNNCQMETTFKCLRNLMKSSTLGSKYTNMTVNNVSAVDDLATALFNVFEVDYPTKPNCPKQIVDFGYFKELIDASAFRRVVCAVHETYGNDAACCLSDLCLIAEIISRSVAGRRFDRDDLTQFVNYAQAIKPNFLVPDEKGDDTPDHETAKDGELDMSFETQTEVGTIEEEDECSAEDEEEQPKGEEIEQNLQSPVQTCAAPVEPQRDNVTEIRQTPASATSAVLFANNPEVTAASPTVTLSVAVPVSSAHAGNSAGAHYAEPLARRDEDRDVVQPPVPLVAMVTPKEESATSVVIEPVPVCYPMTEAFQWQSFPIQAPDTLYVQQFLPMNKRGFGRGLYLLPVASFLENLRYIKNSTE